MSGATLNALALASLGAVCSPASPMFLPNELALQIREAKVALLAINRLSSTERNANVYAASWQARHIVTHKELEQTALDAAKLAGISKEAIYTVGEPTRSNEDLTSIK